MVMTSKPGYLVCGLEKRQHFLSLFFLSIPHPPPCCYHVCNAHHRAAVACIVRWVATEEVRFLSWHQWQLHEGVGSMKMMQAEKMKLLLTISWPQQGAQNSHYSCVMELSCSPTKVRSLRYAGGVSDVQHL